MQYLNWVFSILLTFICVYICVYIERASQVAQMVKNLPAVQATWVRSLAQEDPLEEGMTTHSRILAWSIPWTEEPGGLQLLIYILVDNFHNSSCSTEILTSFP